MIISQKVEARPEGCTLLAPEDLRQTGAIAVTLEGDKATFLAANARGKGRAWSR